MILGSLGGGEFPISVWPVLIRMAIVMRLGFGG